MYIADINEYNPPKITFQTDKNLLWTSFSVNAGRPADWLTARNSTVTSCGSFRGRSEEQINKTT